MVVSPPPPSSPARPRPSLFRRGKRFFRRLLFTEVVTGHSSAGAAEPTKTNRDDDDDKTVATATYAASFQELLQDARGGGAEEPALVLAALAELAPRCRAHRGDAAAVVAAVVAAMQAHPSHPGIQAAGCAVVVELTGSRDAATAAAVIAACGPASGFLDCLAGALRRHPHHPDVQAHACAAVTNLLYRSCGNGLPLVREHAAIALAVAALDRGTARGWAPVQKHACRVLYNLSAFDARFGFDPQIVAAGGHAALLRALAAASKDEPQHGDLLRYGPRVLQRLAGTDGESCSHPALVGA